MFVGDRQAVHGLLLGRVALAKLEGALAGQVGNEEGVLCVRTGEVAAFSGTGVAGRQGTDHHDPAVLHFEVVDEGGPEIAGGLDGEDEVVDELLTGQLGERGRKTRL